MFDSVLEPEQAFDSISAVDRTRVRARSGSRTGPSRRVRAKRLVLGLALVAVGGAWAGPLARAVSGSSEPVSVSRSTYVVRPGDSLWVIAEHLSNGADPRPLVDAIADANHVDPATLVPGQTLLIPAA
jgi:nucleoid-associated protein YgaU